MCAFRCNKMPPTDANADTQNDGNPGQQTCEAWHLPRLTAFAAAARRLPRRILFEWRPSLMHSGLLGFHHR